MIEISIGYSVFFSLLGCMLSYICFVGGLPEWGIMLGIGVLNNIFITFMIIKNKRTYDELENTRGKTDRKHLLCD